MVANLKKVTGELTIKGQVGDTESIGVATMAGRGCTTRGYGGGGRPLSTDREGR